MVFSLYHRTEFLFKTRYAGGKKNDRNSLFIICSLLIQITKTHCIYSSLINVPKYIIFLGFVLSLLPPREHYFDVIVELNGNLIKLVRSLNEDHVLKGRIIFVHLEKMFKHFEKNGTIRGAQINRELYDHDNLHWTQNAKKIVLKKLFCAVGRL